MLNVGKLPEKGKVEVDRVERVWLSKKQTRKPSHWKQKEGPHQAHKPSENLCQLGHGKHEAMICVNDCKRARLDRYVSCIYI